jgi:hypothetical protein
MRMCPRMLAPGSAEFPENGVIGMCYEEYAAPIFGRIGPSGSWEIPLRIDSVILLLQVVPNLAGDSLLPVDRARPDGVDMRAHSLVTPRELALPIAKVIPG